MVIDLTIAGLVEAQVWESSAPWIDPSARLQVTG